MAMRALIRPPHAGATQNDPIGFPCDRFRVAAFARRSCARHPGMLKNPPQKFALSCSSFWNGKPLLRVGKIPAEAEHKTHMAIVSTWAASATGVAAVMIPTSLQNP